MTLKQRPPKKQAAGSGGKRPRSQTAARGGHAPTPAPPRRRTEAGRSKPAEIGQKKAARGPHAYQTVESPLARGNHAPHRRPTGPDLAAERAEGDEDPGWGARVSQKWARKSRSGFQNLKKKGERMGQKITPTTRTLGQSPKEDNLR
jgi:hypothetical protein